MDIYHKNKRFLIAIIIVILITAVITAVKNPSIRLSPQEVFQEKLISGSVCKCIYTGENAERYAQLADNGELTILSIEEPSSSDCLQRLVCSINVRVKEDGAWNKKEIIGTSAYSS